MKPATWILYLYPHRWRQRYEEEMVVLLEQHTITLATLFDLLLGALDARLDPSYRMEKPLFLFKNERTTATTFLCAYALFLFAMYNWHHYIPLSLSLAPYYMNMGLSPQTSLSSLAIASSTGLNDMSSDSLLTLSDFMMQVTLLVSNLFFILLFVKQTAASRRKRFVLPAALCLLLLLTLPLVPLLAVSTSTTAVSSASGVLLAVEIRPPGQIADLYMHSFRLLWPLLTLLISSLFIVLVRLREVMNAKQRRWLLLTVLFSLILPIGRMLWLSSSVQIPSTILPVSAVVLGTTLTYFPPFAGLATMILAIANTDGNRRTWRIALFPAFLLSLALLVKLLVTLAMLPLIWASMLRSFSPWNDTLSIFTFTSMLMLMFLAGGVALIALMHGFVMLKAAREHVPDTDAPLAQGSYPLQTDGSHG